jgi:hypothetical protein
MVLEEQAFFRGLVGLNISSGQDSRSISERPLLVPVHPAEKTFHWVGNSGFYGEAVEINHLLLLRELVKRRKRVFRAAHHS